MQSGTGRRVAIAALALVIVGVSGLAAAQAERTPAETIQYRQTQLRRLGAAFKGVNDQTRAGTPDLDAVRAGAQTISQLTTEFPSWFPAGTGPEAGVETKAKADIWSNAAGFADQVSQLQAAAQGLSTASAGSDMAPITAQARALGARCGSCHSQFRERS